MKQYTIDVETIDGRERYAMPCPDCGGVQRAERVLLARPAGQEILLPAPKPVVAKAPDPVAPPPRLATPSPPAPRRARPREMRARRR